jgi:hypothetical protein
MRNTKIVVALAAALLSTSAYASFDKVAAGVNIGTQGLGIEARTPIIENLYGRLGVNYASFKGKANNGVVDLKSKLHLLTAPVMFDYHPVDGSGFRLSAGLAYNGSYLEGKAAPTSNVTIDGRTYTPAQMGSIKAKLTLGNKIAPILSIGYDSSLVSDSNWSFNAEFGAMYSGKVKMKVTASGLLGSDAQMISDLNRDANKGLDKAQKYLKWYPILSIGLKYKF